MSKSGRKKAGESDTAVWVAVQVARYAKVHKHFKQFADVLTDVLGHVAKKLAPLAIIEARAKAIPHFAEKILRKRRLYQDPLIDITDLCGGRVIVHTAEQVQAVSQFIEEHFTIDWDNSADVSQRLRPTEFGYRSVHYIVSFKPEEFPNKDVPIDIPRRLLDGLPARLFKPSEHHPYKAEIQVRTILEHAWADISHDMVYKTEFKVPIKIQRDFASIAAVLEATDHHFARLHEALHVYAAEQGKYMTRENIREEIGILEIVSEHDKNNVALATKIATLAMAIGDWEKAVSVLKPHRASDYQPALRTLGVALCKHYGGRSGNIENFRSGRTLLEEATGPPHRDPEGLCLLADNWRAEDEDRARKLYRQAFELDSTHPMCLANYLECEIACQRNNAIISLVTPTIAAAIRRCRSQIEANVNLPWAYLGLGKFYLLLGQPYESLSALAKAIERCPAPFILEAAKDSLKRLRVIADKLPGYQWAWRLVLLGQAVKYPEQLPDAFDELRRLQTSQCPRIEGPIIIVAGGCDQSVEQQMQGYRQLLIEGFKDFTGTILSGGTTQGIPRLVGDVRQHYGNHIHAIGYTPHMVPADATIDWDTNRYDEIRRTDGSGFSPLEPLQNWIDLVASRVEPKDVKVLGINGGIIAAAEYRIAAALGAQVVLLDKSGREAAKTFSNPDWG
ncbi:MAG TPA: hypothetical protein DD670_06220, partial [Planctomycetaceae bacterium]|nr:hypothetical protein [Planctomycetaceae bacterium]